MVYYHDDIYSDPMNGQDKQDCNFYRYGNSLLRR
jgi:hypothetical protein